MVGGCENKKDTENQSQPGEGLVKGWGNEDEHQPHKRTEREPVKRSEIKQEGHEGHKGIPA